MASETCSMSNIEKLIKTFYKKFAKFKDCNSGRRLKRYYDNIDKLSNQ